MDQPPDSVPSKKLPRSRIIRRRSTFTATRLKGRRVSNKWLSLNTLGKSSESPEETVAFLTPKRLGSAVIRNRLRRQMREIYRRYVAQPSETAYLVWVARPPALELDFEHLKQAMLELRNRAGVTS